MDERHRARTKDDDVPIIGDYSEAADAQLRQEAEQATEQRGRSRHAATEDVPPQRPEARPQAAPGARRGRSEWALDPSDVRRHAALKRQRERASPLARVARWGAVALVLVVAVGIWRNFDTLRGITLDYSGFTSLFEHPTSDGTRKPAGSGESGTVDVAAPVVAGERVPASTGPEPPPVAERARDRPAEPRAAAADSSAAAQVEPPAPEEAAAVDAAVASPPPPGAEAEPSDTSSEPPADDTATRVAAAAPPPAGPEPPPEPESFDFGISATHVSEAAPSANILILRNGDRRHVSSITWWTQDGTAKAGSDYINLGMVAERFAAGEQNRTIHVPIVGDHNVEGPEDFYVLLSPSGGADPSDVRKIEVIIDDDD